MTMTRAYIYKRINGEFGAACDGCLDTGHRIIGLGNWFTVFSVIDDETPIAINVIREDTELAIADDWRATR